jgi:hypothetical protein
MSPSVEDIQEVGQLVMQAVQHLPGRTSMSLQATSQIESLVKGALQQAVAKGLIPVGYLLVKAYPVEDIGEYRLSIMQDFVKFPLDAIGYHELFGRPPVQDDLHRVNCDQAGTPGHWMCGACLQHRRPRFECGCVIQEKT